MNDGFSETNGARPAAEAVPRVLVVVTDGQSGDSVVAPSNNVGPFVHRVSFFFYICGKSYDSIASNAAKERSTGALPLNLKCM